MVSEIRSQRAAGFSPERQKLLELLLQKKGRESNSHPLSFAQQRLWFNEQLEPGRAIYNIPTARVLKGKLNVAALEAALTEIVGRHESLRTTFRTVAGEVAQVVGPVEEKRLELL